MLEIIEMSVLLKSGFINKTHSGYGILQVCY